MTTRPLTPVLLVALSACMTSPSALTVARADPQRGAFGSVYMSDKTQHSGELLAIDDSTIILLTKDRIAIGSLSRIAELSFDNFETSDVGAQRHMSPGTLRKGRQASRFPYGIAPTVMARLLENAKQAAPDTLDTFVVEARRATRRYESQREAINDGFTRVGVEFPAMGEHWVSFARVNEDSLAADRPSVLIYTNVDGEPRLAGVAYTKLLSGHDEPPNFPFVGAWHEHSGAVNEESLPMGHSHAVVPSATPPVVPSAAPLVVPSAARDLLLPFRRSPPAEDSPRLFILHAWLFTENPDGIFATDNWSLPLTRLGLPNGSMEKDALRAIALAQDDDEYHRMVLRTQLHLSNNEDSAVARVVEGGRLRAERADSAMRASRQVTRETSARLSDTWADMWLQLERALPTRVAELRHLRAMM